MTYIWGITVFSLNSLWRQVYLSSELQKKRMLSAPVPKIDHIMYNPGSKAFATHMHRHMLFWTSATFFLSQTKE